MKAALFPNTEKQGVIELTTETIAHLTRAGITCLKPGDIPFGDCENADEEELYRLADVILTIGGDGTLIRHAKRAAEYGKPILGINAGRLGFLTDLERDCLDWLAKLSDGDYTTESHMMLSVEIVRDGETLYNGLALNDAVVSGGSVARLADMTLQIAGDVLHYRADGLIFSTSTGSTAYSMSAGGPIIDPSVRCFGVTPICPHQLTARPILVNEASEMTVTVSPSSRSEVFLTVDGRHCGKVGVGTEVRLKKAPYDVKFINISGRSFYKRLSLKF